MVDDLLTVGTFQFPAEAEAARIYLEGEGIQTFVSDGETASMDWLLSNAIGYTKLQVPTSQANAAFAALERMESLKQKQQSPSQEKKAVPVCLACGAEFPANQPACSECGWTYADSEDESESESQDLTNTTENVERSETPSVMDHFRSMKRPLIWLMLAPTLVIGIILLLQCLAYFVSALSH